MTAVHFGAGNIGRGFIGLLLHDAGHELVFLDVNGPLIAAIAAADSYRVIEIGGDERIRTVTGFTGIDSSADPEGAAAAVAGADVVTTAVGPSILRFIAPVVAAGLRARPADRAPLPIMACENALGATDLLRGHLAELLADDPAVLDRAVFANTAVDRIVPIQEPEAGRELDVRVEPFCEWAIEAGPFAGSPPAIPGAHLVDDLAPYIERKLFTVNTGHAATAYLGRLAGAAMIDEALTMPAVRAGVEAALRETSRLLVSRHGFPLAVQDAYRETALVRFANPALRDGVERVGRQPLRKLSRNERLIQPAAALAEQGIEPVGLLAVIAAALRFQVANDPESAELQKLLGSGSSSADLVESITGVEPGHPLFAALEAAVDGARAEGVGA
ncbi:mannitol-1-phosphate 5-dehydrogenase [Microcella alkalica]|uniref:Mannitol-1-phosphate 5-dehydrogenase n=1 Tax=Microcella alkalica TaxID=355930 RepID=A0A839E879_9MICO|nr:mannitol-1-phosphate 5-dehydrogenase [Microcella alkalica]MBA8847980.1 mannitol-1-phosphate 5-dehydrogenase [Microcella alkalica]